MKISRRRLLKHTLIGIPVLSGLSACGGGGTANASSDSTVTFSQGPDLDGAGISGTQLVSYSALAKPSKLQTVTDPDFSNRIVRITDVKSDWNSQFAVPVYPTTQAWNCDETLMILYVSGSLGTGGHEGDYALFDGMSYAFIQFIDINPADVEQFYWSTTDPQLLYYVDNNQRSGTQVNALTEATITATTKNPSGTITAVSMTTRVVHDFAPDFATGGALATAVKGDGTITLVSGGEDPFAMSLTNDLIGLGAYLNKNGSGGASAFAAFSYRISTNTIGTPFTVEADVPQALPSGTGTYFYKNESDVYVLDAETNAVRYTIPYDGTQHSDMLLNKDGDDIIAGPQFDGPSNGTLVWANLSKGGSSQTLITAYPPSGTLISGRCYKNPGWVAMGMVGCPAGTNGNCNGSQPIAASDPKTYLDQEVLIANIDSGACYRVAHHRSTGKYFNATDSQYWAQPNVTISPSGTRILFQSDWGAGDPANPVIDANAIIDTYVVELPQYSA